MKKFATLAAAAAVALTGAAPALAQSVANSDPFVSSQASAGLLTIGGVGGIVITTVIVAIVVAIADSSSSSTT